MIATEDAAIALKVQIDGIARQVGQLVRDEGCLRSRAVTGVHGG